MTSGAMLHNSGGPSLRNSTCEIFHGNSMGFHVECGNWTVEYSMEFQWDSLEFHGVLNLNRYSAGSSLLDLSTEANVRA